MTKIIEKILSIREKNNVKGKYDGEVQSLEREKEKIDTQKHFPPEWYYSFEFFPPKTEAGLDNLLTRIDRMSARLDPLFIDVTFSYQTAARSMAVAAHAQKFCGVDVLLHLTCTGMTKDFLAVLLQQAKLHGIQNLLCLRGDPPRGKSSWEKDDISGGECDRAIDLVRFIRELYGDYFCIAVAGHPEGHPSSHSLFDEISHLKDKIDAGGDFIITQFFYDTEVYLDFVKRCRENDILAPILPGILPIYSPQYRQSFASFKRMTECCNIFTPQSLLDRLEVVKNDDEAVKEIGYEIAIETASKILTTSFEEGGMDGIHFYTLNLERSVTRILTAMDAISLEHTYSTLTNGDDITHLASAPSKRRQFPWRPSTMEQREREDVRPINWANRPKSYVMRTEDWDEFPNGRWGDSTSPAFGELSDLSHFYSSTFGSEDNRRTILGFNPTKPQDVNEVFARYIEGNIPYLPWCETSLKAESFTMQSDLAQLNRAGYLTINSQPSINGLHSSHPVFGWGGEGGYVYQKAYLECFVSPEKTRALLELTSRNPSLNLYAVNNNGDTQNEGMSDGGVTALTWGVFPNREVVQPTIFDPETFLIWAEEAYALWTSTWLSLYDFDSESYELIENIRDTYYLVAIIDNDYVSDDNHLIHQICNTIL